MSDGFWLTCLINYKNKNNLSAFHDTKLASQTIKIFLQKYLQKLIILKKQQQKNKKQTRILII